MRWRKALCLLLVLAATPAFANPIVLKFAAGLPSSSDLWIQTLAPWAARVEAASKGTLKIDKYPDAILAAQGQTIDRVAAGVADIAWDLPLLYGQRFQSLSVAGLPFMYDDAEKASVALWRLYKKGLVAGEVNNVMMLAFVMNPNVDLFLKEPLKDNGDLNGIKISVGSQTRAQIVRGLGGVPVSLKAPDVYQALSRGVVDGAMTNVAVIESQKLNDKLHYYLEGPLGGAVAVVIMNRAKFNALPPEAKQAILENSEEIGSRRMSRESAADEVGIMNDLLKTPRNKRVRLEGAALEKWRKTLNPILTDWAKSWPRGQAVEDAFRAELANVK